MWSKMKLYQKIISTITLIFIIIGIIFLLIYKHDNKILTKFLIKDFVLKTRDSYVKLEKEIINKALFLSSALAKYKPFYKAYKMQESEGRNYLRKVATPIIENIKKEDNLPVLKVHFHKPPAISFLRIWRKPGQKDGGDDISSFRKSVLKVFETHRPVKGIEIGRGGLVLRGISPIIDDNGNYLGSVEVLIPFNELFLKLKTSINEDFAIFMKPEYLKIATKLSTKPMVSGYVLVSSTNSNIFKKLSKSEISEGMKTYKIFYNKDLSSYSFFPVKDFSGKIVGSICYYFKPVKILSAIHSTLVKLITFVVPLMIIALIILIFLIKLITKQISIVTEQLKLFSSGDANLSHRLIVKSQDEVGELALAFNKFVEILHDKIGDVRLLGKDVKINVLNSEILSGKLQNSSTIIKEELNNVSSSIEELLSSIKEVSNSIENIKEKNREVLSIGNEMTAITEQVTESMHFATESVSSTAKEIEAIAIGIEDIALNIEQVSDRVNEIFNTVEVMKYKINDTNKLADNVFNEIESISSAVNEQSANIDNVSSNAENAKELSEETLQKANEGMDKLQELLNAVDSIKSYVSNVGREISELSGMAQNIGEITVTIDEISDQANCLR